MSRRPLTSFVSSAVQSTQLFLREALGIKDSTQADDQLLLDSMRKDRIHPAFLEGAALAAPLVVNRIESDELGVTLPFLQDLKRDANPRLTALSVSLEISDFLHPSKKRATCRFEKRVWSSRRAGTGLHLLREEQQKQRSMSEPNFEKHAYLSNGSELNGAYCVD